MVSNEPIFSLDWAPDAIIVTGPDGSVLHVNPRAEDLFGYRKDELADKPLALLIPEGLTSAVLEASPLQRAGRTVVCAHRDGTRFLSSVRWRPGPGGDEDFVVFSLRDLDGEDPANAAGHAPSAEDDRRIDTSLVLAHDVRESLQAIQYLCDALGDRAPEEAATVSEIIDGVAKLLERLTRFSSVSAIEPQVEPCRLGDLLGTLARELAPLADRKGLRLSVVDIEDAITTDPVLFRELLHNLLANAIRYTDAGHVDVRCEASTEAVLVEIIDTGVGIHPDHLAAMLGRGDSLEGNDDAAPRRGAGLGLAIVHQLAQLLRCSIRIDSTPGRGSRFTVVAPRTFDVPARSGA